MNFSETVYLRKTSLTSGKLMGKNCKGTSICLVSFLPLSPFLSIQWQGGVQLYSFAVPTIMLNQLY